VILGAGAVAKERGKLKMAARADFAILACLPDLENVENMRQGAGFRRSSGQAIDGRSGKFAGEVWLKSQNA